MKVVTAAIIALVVALGLAAPAFASTTTFRHETTTTGWSRNKSGEHVFTVVHTIVITKVETITKTITTPGPTVYAFPTVCQQAINEYAAAMNNPIDAGLFAIYQGQCDSLMYPSLFPAVVATPALGWTTSRHETTTAGWSVNKHGVHVLTVVHTVTINRAITNTVVHTVRGPTVYAYPGVCQQSVDQPSNNDAYDACQNLLYPPLA